MIRYLKTLVMAVVALATAAGNPQAGEPAEFDASGPVNIDELFQLAQVTVPGRGCANVDDCHKQEIICRNRCVGSGNFCHKNCYDAEVNADPGVVRIPPALPFDDPRYEQAMQQYNRFLEQDQQQRGRAASVRRQCDQGCRNTRDQCEHTCSQIYGYSN